MSNTFKLPSGRLVINNQVEYGTLENLYSIDLENGLICAKHFLEDMHITQSIEVINDCFNLGIIPIYQIDATDYFHSTTKQPFIKPLDVLLLLSLSKDKYYTKRTRDFICSTVIPFISLNKIKHDNFKKDAIMKHEIITKQYNDNIVTFDLGDDVMINLTDMAKANCKDVFAWRELKSTQEFLIEYQTQNSGFEMKQILKVKKGGKNSGTWANQDVALEFARWCSPKFAVWCNMQIKELMTKGSVTIQQPETKPIVKTEERTKAINASFLSYADKMIDRMKLNDNSKQIARANLLHELVGIPVEPMLPATEHRLSAEEIGEKLGTSANMVGRIANLLKLKDDSDLCERRLSKSQYSNKEVEQCFYSPAAVDLIKLQLLERKAS